MRTFSRRAVAASLVLVALVGGCSGGGGTDDAGAPGASTTAPAVFAFALTGTAVEAMSSEPPAFPAEVSAGVKAGLETWLGRAVVDPLRTGRPSSGLDAVFTPPALVKVSAPGPERAAVVEEGTEISGAVRQQRANAALTALTDTAGAVVLVTAQIDLVHSVTTDAAGGTVDVVRSGELVLVAEGGTWRIDAFDVVARHDTRAA